MRFVGVILALAAFVAGAGFVSVGVAQAHGGSGGGAVEVSQSACAVFNPIAQESEGSCTNLVNVGDRQ
jgi:hypothetical protein